MTRVLFVCMGNICRSPTAHGIFRDLVREAGLDDAVEVDSAGTGAWHAGNPPDQRSMATAARRGCDISDLRARQVTVDDFDAFDHVIAMDSENMSNLRRLCPEGREGRLSMCLDHASEASGDVPDPYYGNDGFDLVYDMCDDACRGLLATIRADLGR